MQASDTHDVARADDETNPCQLLTMWAGLAMATALMATIAHDDDAMSCYIFARDGNPNEYLPGGFLGMTRDDAPTLVTAGPKLAPMLGPRASAGDDARKEATK
jgi:hypothetical protein